MQPGIEVMNGQDSAKSHTRGSRCCIAQSARISARLEVERGLNDLGA